MTQNLARVSARKPSVVIGIWVVAIVAAVLLSARLLDTATTTELVLGDQFEPQKAATALERLRGGPEPISEIVIVQSDSLTVKDTAFRSKVESVFDDVIELGHETVLGGSNYYLTGDESMVSADRKTTFFLISMAGDFDDASRNVEQVMDIVEEADEVQDFTVLITGDASISFESNEFAVHDLEQGERVGVPVALLILLALFGAVAAALLPIGVAVVAIIIALGIVAVLGQVLDLVLFVTLQIAMIGLAVGIDYSLFFVSRFREELDRGMSVIDAVVRAGETAGRTVLFSGVTVVIALCGLFIVPMGFFQSLAIGAILVVIIALAATLTLLPAVLVLLGHKVDSLSIPFFRRRKTGATEERGKHDLWEWVTHTVTKVPLISFLVVAVPMLAVTAFYFDIETGRNGVEALPDSSKTKEAFVLLQEQFEFGPVPTNVVIEGDIDSPEVQDAIRELTKLIVDDPRFPEPPVLDPTPSSEIASLKMVMPGPPTRGVALDAVTALREEHIPAAFDGVSAEVNVGGLSATTVGMLDIVDRYTPIVFVFVLGFSFIVLLLVFRSIVIPIKAVIMNLLSVGTAYGLMVLVFQKGFAVDLLGFQRAEVIDAWIPLALFAILFGLSMDYHVFLLSRVRERYDQTGDNVEAVSYGLRSTASLITGAALIMVAVFGAFAAGKTIVNQQVGFGLAVAILLDATLVRSVLVPASMEMLGKGNWYLPSWLQWLPDLRVEAEE